MSFYLDKQFDKLSERWALTIIARERGAAKTKDVSAAFNAMTDYLDERFQAATEAAKATGTAGELPPLPDTNCWCVDADIYGSYDAALRIAERDNEEERLLQVKEPKYVDPDWEPKKPHALYDADQMRAYGQQCAEAARQPAPALPVNEIAKKLNALDMAIAHSTNLTPHSKPRRLLAAIIHEICSDAALAATAAPVLSDGQIFAQWGKCNEPQIIIDFARRVLAAATRSQP